MKITVHVTATSAIDEDALSKWRMGPNCKIGQLKYFWARRHHTDKRGVQLSWVPIPGERKIKLLDRDTPGRLGWGHLLGLYMLVAEPKRRGG